MTDYHIREAAESLLGSGINPHYSRNISHSQSINLVSEDLVAGHRPGGQMSTVRRFFCLFVTFDVLFTGLVWLICVVMKGESLEDIMKREIVNYKIKVSLFDIVMLAITRFTVLLLFYGLLYINNWSVIALSTGGTCAFLIAKVFVFDWPDASQPVYIVFLILTSFTIAWSETWFLDSRVLPQEMQAKQILEAFVHHNTERTPLLAPQRPPDVQSAYGESTVNWFSPVETPEHSPRHKRPGEEVILTQEQVRYSPTGSPESIGSLETPEHSPRHKRPGEEVIPTQEQVRYSPTGRTPEHSPRHKRPGEEVILTQEQIDEYKSQAEESMQNAWRIVTSSNWRVEKKGATRGDVVESKQTEQFGKVYRLTSLVNCPPQFLYEEFKNNITRLPDWNPTILKSEVIKQISDGIDLSYQVTAGGGKGIIAPRDFVILRRMAPLSREGLVTSEEPYCYISSGVSVAVPGHPPRRDMVRGHNKVGCWVLKPKTVQTQGGKIEQQTVFQWLMCCDLKGKIPQFVLDAAFATVMLDYIVHVRKFVADAKDKGVF